MQGEGKAAGKADEPQKVGYKTFQSGKEAADYFKKLLQNLTKNQDLNEVLPWRPMPFQAAILSASHITP